MKIVYKLILGLTLLLIVNTAFAQNDLRGWITGTVTGRATPDTLIFGVHDNATFCTDSSLGESEAPPLPPSDVFAFRFVNPRLGGDGSSFCFGQGRGDLLGSNGLDLRPFVSETQRDTFRVLFQPGSAGLPLTLTWPSGLDTVGGGTGWDSLTLREISLDPEACPTTAINMLTGTTHTINCSEISGFRIIAIRPRPTAIGANLENNLIPESFTLTKNYPNPFNPTTAVKFAIQKTAMTTVVVYDMLGRKVATLVSEQLAPGYYNTSWNGLSDNGVPAASGTYYIRMNARYENEDGASDEFVSVQKTLLMK